MSSLVEIPGLSKEIIEMPWLVSFGWYLTIMLHMDVAAGAGAGVAGAMAAV